MFLFLRSDTLKEETYTAKPQSRETFGTDFWDKVLKSRLSKFCGRQPLKNFKLPYSFKFFKGCLPQNLLSRLLNTLFHL